jgi:hypothetical protein
VNGLIRKLAAEVQAVAHAQHVHRTHRLLDALPKARNVDQRHALVDLTVVAGPVGVGRLQGMGAYRVRVRKEAVEHPHGVKFVHDTELTLPAEAGRSAIRSSVGGSGPERSYT